MKEKEEMGEFLSSLQGVTFATADPKAILEEMEITNEVKQRARDYIEAAEEATK